MWHTLGGQLLILTFWFFLKDPDRAWTMKVTQKDLKTPFFHLGLTAEMGMNVQRIIPISIRPLVSKNAVSAGKNFCENIG
jgi:hypothetical protein